MNNAVIAAHIMPQLNFTIMRLFLTSLVPLTFLAIGCGDSKSVKTEYMEESRKDSTQRAKLETLPMPTGRVARLIEQLESSDRQAAFDAATELGNMGSDAIAAIPALVDLATFDEKGSHRIHPTLAAGEALSKISIQAAVPHLIESLELHNKRYWASKILGEFGADARPAVPALVDAVRAVARAQTEDEQSASAQAAAALARIRPQGLSALVSEMGHKDVAVRKLAVWATPRGADGKPAVNALAQRLSDDDSEIRTLAANALADIGPDAREALPFIKMALNKERNEFAVLALKGAMDSVTDHSKDKPGVDKPH